MFVWLLFGLKLLFVAYVHCDRYQDELREFLFAVWHSDFFSLDVITKFNETRYKNNNNKVNRI